MDLQDTLEAVREINNLSRAMGTKSLKQSLKMTRISPRTFIDSDLMAMDEDQRTALLQTLNSLYAADYLAAVSLEVAIGDVRVMNILEKFATERDPMTAMINGPIANSGYLFPSAESSIGSLAALRAVGEASANASVIELDDPSNLAVGKTLDIPLIIDGQQYPLRATVRLYPTVMNSKDLVRLISAQNIDKTWLGRYRMWKADLITTSEYFTGSDVRRKEVSARISDDSGIYRANTSRREKGFFATLLSGQGSMNSLSDIQILTNKTAEEVEMELGGRLKDRKFRDKFFGNTLSCMLVVVDMYKERFRLYHHSIDEVGVYAFSEIKKNARNQNGIDVNEVLRMYSKSEMPSRL